MPATARFPRWGCHHCGIAFKTLVEGDMYGSHPGVPGRLKFRRLAGLVMGPAAAGWALNALSQIEKMRCVQEVLLHFVVGAA